MVDPICPKGGQKPDACYDREGSEYWRIFAVACKAIIDGADPHQLHRDALVKYRKALVKEEKGRGNPGV